MTTRFARAGLVCVIAMGLLAGCGGGEGGGEGAGLPTRSPGLSPTRTPPTGEPTRELTKDPASRSTEAETGTGDSQPSEQAEEPPTSASQGSSDDEGVPAEAWWLLAVVLLAGAALTWALVARSRSRRGWQDRLRTAEADVGWLARELLPQLRSTGSLDRALGGWQVALPRVAAAEDQLTVLESTVPDEVAGARARALRNAVRRSRARRDRLAGEGPGDVWARDIDQAIAELEAALAPAAVTPPR
jgi:hypothetical protein